ncbi:sensor histidine kinase [Actinosynnema pretiosum subsp. pretiosum]|uniref:Sensor histidine kinase n=1 Tax=Actinosynnema pretiosum subsp. pretiosum TaxID=103721 RepID=A0AA45LC12_9PSEU|nr:sensor histidine kinase [Actinosynnema pretiosum subsp. pretiosum]
MRDFGADSPVRGSAVAPERGGRPRHPAVPEHANAATTGPTTGPITPREPEPGVEHRIKPAPTTRTAAPDSHPAAAPGAAPNPAPGSRPAAPAAAFTAASTAAPGVRPAVPGAAPAPTAASKTATAAAPGSRSAAPNPAPTATSGALTASAPTPGPVPHPDPGIGHETVLCSSDSDLLASAGSFAAEGLALGEPVLLACAPERADLLRSRLAPPTPGLLDLPLDPRPAEALLVLRRKVDELLRGGAERVRVVGGAPSPRSGAGWDWWARFELAVTEVFADAPVRVLCPYDLRVTPDRVVADVLRAHPGLLRPDGEHVPNPGHAPGAVVAGDPPHPLEAGPALVDALDPTPAEARRAIERATAATALTDDEHDDVVYAASEAVTNGLSHGRAPVRLRVWADRERVLVVVTDRGQGPPNRLAGIVPTEGSSTAGLGLWLTHRTCRDVALTWAPDGFTVRVLVGAPSPPRER